jgi:hypothetical protein
MNRRSQRQGIMLWGISFATLPALLFMVMPVKAASLPPAFSDGQWKGSYSVHAKAPFGGFTWDGYYNGDLVFESAAGALDGLWTLHGAGQYSGSITGSATYLGGGKVGGTASVPNLLVEEIDVTVNIIAAGFPVSQTTSVNDGGLEIKLVSSTCTQAVGDISTPVIGNYQSAGVNPNVTGSFSAVRVGSLKKVDPQKYLDAVSALMDQADAFKQDVLGGKKIEFDQLDALVTKAESLALAIQKNQACGQGGNKSYLTVITDIVAELVKFALAHPSGFTTDELGRLLQAALRVGAMGSGAANQQQAAELAAGFLQEYDNRLTEAVNKNDCEGAISIKAAAFGLGDPDLITQAGEVVAIICGGN